MLDTTNNVTDETELRVSVARLDERTQTLTRDVGEIKKGMVTQSSQLDLLVADLHTRKGAAKQRNLLGRAAFTVATGTGFLGWIWEHFHK